MTAEPPRGAQPQGKGGIGGGLAGLFGGGGIGEQLLVWSVLQSLLSQLMQPAIQQVMSEVWPKVTSGRLSPEQAADLVLKGWWDQTTGQGEAEATGLSSDRFAELVHAAGEPISPELALEAVRRGVLPVDGPQGTVSFLQAVKESRLRPEWAGTLQALQWRPVPVADAVDALVKHQVDDATAREYARHGGVRDAEFDVLYHTRGNPPSPSELVELMRRGYIPRDGTGPDTLSFQQGIAEGATKDKWWELFAKLQEYLPPPRTITALEREGALTPEQAQELYQRSGLSPELAAAYAKGASTQKTQKHRDLAEATVLDLYEAHVITEQECTDGLATLGFDAAEATWLIELRDMRRTLTALNSAVNRVGSLYIARKLTDQEAGAALDHLGVQQLQRDHLLTMWKLEQDATVRILSAAEVGQALYYNVIDAETATRYLLQLGYSKFDAWVFLGIHNHGPLDNAPPDGGNVRGRAQ